MIFKDVLRFYVLTSFENLRIWVEDSPSLNITKHSERNRQLNFFRLVSVIGNLFLIFFYYSWVNCKDDETVNCTHWFPESWAAIHRTIDFNSRPRVSSKQLHSCIFPLLDELSLWKLSQIFTENWLYESKKLYFLVRRITTLRRRKLHETNCTKLTLEITLTLVYSCR